MDVNFHSHFIKDLFHKFIEYFSIFEKENDDPFEFWK
jgi:hypothetical protein